MKLYIYQGLEHEKVPKDVTHVIVDSSVTVIKSHAFSWCRHLVSVIMGDNVKKIEDRAFWDCSALRFVRLSKTLEYIECRAFYECESLEALFLPSTVKSIKYQAFIFCPSLRILILPNDIDLSQVVGIRIVDYTLILAIARAAGVEYEVSQYSLVTRVEEWLKHHMDDSSFHKLCYTSSVTTKHINNYLIEHGNDSALAIDAIHGMTPLHMLSMNPHAPANAVAALLDVNVEVAFRLDNQGRMSLDYARDYNVGGLISMIGGLCNHRQSA